MKNTATQHTLSRRRFAKTVSEGTLIVGFNAAIGSWVTNACARSAAPFHALPRLDGTLLLDESSRLTYAQDYGQIIHERPLAVLLPGSVEDILRMLRFARYHGLRIAARGQGHQPFGQAQVEGGIVIDMRALGKIRAISDERVDVDAGADWRAVVHAASRHGRTPPVLPAYLGLTVGGTLSIGGIGVTSFRHGAQIDHVLELQVVTGDGRVLSCSERKHPDLFEAALAGQGQCGIITRAVLRLVPAQPMIREYLLPYAALAPLLEDELSLAEDDRFDGAVALIDPSPAAGSFALSAIRQFTPPHVPDDAALTRGLRALAGAQQIRDVSYLEYVDAIPSVPFTSSRADLGLFVPGSAAAQFLGNVLPRLNPQELGMALAMRVFFWKRRPFTRPLFRIPKEETFMYMALLRPETSDRDVLARMLAGNRALFEQNRALGGTLYPFSALELRPSDWNQQYGNAGPALAAAKSRYDPGNVFASGPGTLRAKH
ncbi:MAG TPA: FAD-binding protein [Polyangiaceae bacterium]|nr:FAD-binding protein [Polyangiaceae bacterium]